MRSAAVAAVMVCLATAGCAGDLDPPLEEPSVSPSVTIKEAFARLPIDGTKQTPITWDLGRQRNPELVLGAQRGLAFLYWQWGSADWTPIMPVGRFVYTNHYYQWELSSFAGVTDFAEPATGPLWIKVMGVDEEKVTFCTDRGHWRKAGGSTGRAQLETLGTEVENDNPEGYSRYVVRSYEPLDEDMHTKYQAECTKWAQHKP